MSAARVMFVEPPPTVDWQPDSGLSTGGRRHPSTSVTGEQVYSYYNLSAAAVLREQGHEVFYIHCQTEGISLKDLEEKISAISPHFLVIMVEHISLSASLETAKIAGRMGIRIIFVGPMATAFDDQMIGSGADYIVRGEWDWTLNNLVTALAADAELSTVKGVSYKNNGPLVRNENAELIDDLDKLPMPAYDLVDFSKFWESIFLYRPTATVVSSRGCPYECIFCSFPQTIFSREFRVQSPERVLAEAKYLKEKFGVKAIRYDDDTFDVDNKRTRRICELFIKEKLGLKWMIQSRPNLMTEEIARMLKKAGCHLVVFGIETSDDDILKKIKKGTTKTDMVKGFNNARKAGLEIFNCIMLGFYWDTKESIERTYKFACDLNAEFTEFSIPIPLPGTEYYEFLKDKNCFRSSKWEDFNSFHSANQDLPNFNNEYINEKIRKCYRYYYLRPKYLTRMLSVSLTSFAKMKRFIRLITAYGKRWLKGWI